MKRVAAAIAMFLLVVCAMIAVAVYENVYADDTEVRAKAEDVARKAVGCGDDCSFAHLEGSRGVLKEMLTYSFRGKPDVTVKCQREFIGFGDYRCEVSK